MRVQLPCATQRYIQELHRLCSCADYTLSPVSKAETLRVWQHDALDDAMRDVIATRGSGLDLSRDVIGRHAATLNVAHHSLRESVHITVHGVALHKVRHRLRRSEHVVVRGEVFGSPSVDHGGGGIGDVGIGDESNEIRLSGVGQKVKVKLDLVISQRVCGVALAQGRRGVSASGSRGLIALGDLRQVRFRSGPRERSRLEAVILLKAHGCSQLRLEPLGPSTVHRVQQAATDITRRSTGLIIEYLTR